MYLIQQAQRHEHLGLVIDLHFDRRVSDHNRPAGPSDGFASDGLEKLLFRTMQGQQGLNVSTRPLGASDYEQTARCSAYLHEDGLVGMA